MRSNAWNVQLVDAKTGIAVPARITTYGGVVNVYLGNDKESYANVAVRFQGGQLNAEVMDGDDVQHGHVSATIPLAQFHA